MLISEKKIWTPDNSDLLKYRGMAQAGDVIIGQDLQIELDNLAEDIAVERFLYDVTDAVLAEMGVDPDKAKGPNEGK